MKTLEPLIEKYITLLDGETDNPERYKWEAIAHFQEYWNSEAEDFSEMFNKAFAKRKNLIYYNSFGFLQKLALHFPEECREMFMHLYDERLDLRARFAQWKQRAEALLPLLKERTEKKLNHQQDERTIAFLLVLRFPSDYFLYKENVYRDLCFYLDAKPLNEVGEKYFHFEELSTPLLASIRENENLQKAVKGFIPVECEFDSTRLILQDIIYRVLSNKDLISNYLESVRIQLMEQFTEDKHPLAQHFWPDYHSDSGYRWISVWKQTTIDPYFFHYEFRLDHRKIRCELHVEGSTAFKTFMEPFLVSQCRAPHKLASWLFGDEESKKGFHKIVGHIHTSYRQTDEPTADELEEIKRGLLDLYDTYQKPLEIYLKRLPNNIIQHYTQPMEIPLNQILYGPPGTGKTYATIIHALHILEGTTLEELEATNRSELLLRFENFKLSGQVDMVTFHQSYAYEDFIEGIKPLPPEQDDSFVKYAVIPGVFTRMTQNAKSVPQVSDKQIDWDKPRFFKMSLGGKNRPDLHDWCIENNVVGIGWGGDNDLSGLSKIKAWKQYRDDFRARFPETAEENRYHIQASFIFNSMNTGDIVVVSKGNHVIDAVGRIVGDYFYDENSTTDFAHFRRVEWIANDLNTLPEKFFRKQISQQSIYEFYDTDIKREAFKDLTHTHNEEKKPHVFIIDEINRGNVSAIFGELITLIEEDKRLGAKNAMSVRLPYSRTLFGIPENLYIIGTMNTADRSVEALDTALRRRFSFVEMLPDAGKIRTYGKNAGRVEGFDLGAVLELINNRIELLVDRDHTIGHAYFMEIDSIEKLRQTFERNIIPLLQEYFYGDYVKMEMVIGPGFFSQPPVVKFATNPFDVDTSGFKRLENIGNWSADRFKEALHQLTGETKSQILPDLNPSA